MKMTKSRVVYEKWGFVQAHELHRSISSKVHSRHFNSLTIPISLGLDSNDSLLTTSPLLAF